MSTCKSISLPEWIGEWREVEIEFSNEGIKNSPFSIHEKESQTSQNQNPKVYKWTNDDGYKYTLKTW